MTNREHIMQEFAKMSDAEFERVVLDATGGLNHALDMPWGSEKCPGRKRCVVEDNVCIYLDGKWLALPWPGGQIIKRTYQ